MSLRDQAALDCIGIVEDLDGFAHAITVTSPEGLTAVLNGQSTDVHTTIDPETGIAVSGRRASVVLTMSALEAAGFSLPRNIAEANSKPWVVAFADIRGTVRTFKVCDAQPDHAIGIVVCHLEAYRPAA